MLYYVSRLKPSPKWCDGKWKSSHFNIILLKNLNKRRSLQGSDGKQKPGPPTKQLMVARGVDADTNMIDVSIAKTKDTATENRYKSSWRKGSVNPIVGRNIKTARVYTDSGSLHNNVDITGVSADNGTTPINKRTVDGNVQDDKEIEGGEPIHDGAPIYGCDSR